MRTLYPLLACFFFPSLIAQPVCEGLQANFEHFTTPNGTQFSNATTGTGQSTTWFWTFGDGDTSVEAQPFHAFPEPGVYEVCLTAISIYEGPDGQLITCTDSICAPVLIQGGDLCDFLQACFVPSQVGPSSVFFNNCTPNEQGTQFLWEFGDGTLGDGVAPTHTFPGPGTYTVCLTATWQNCVDSTCTVIVVEGGGDPCEALDVNFEWNTTPNGTQFFNATAGTGFSTNWFWDFGDGTVGDGVQPFHTYAEPGIYEVCLSATSLYETPNGVIACIDTQCHAVVIEGVGPCDWLQACFVPSQTGPLTVFFNNCTPNETGTQYLWDFGDGTLGDGIAPTHTFPGPGSYQVCLTATWQNCVDSTCTVIVVEGGGDPCNGDFTISFTWDAVGNAVVFQANSTPQANAYFWDFGDNNDGFGQTITQLYEPPGPYEVCLTAWYWNEQVEDTCWATSCQLVDPFTVGMADFGSSPSEFLLYPVPAHDHIVLYSEEVLEGSALLSLFGIDGRLEKQELVFGWPHTMRLEGLASGIQMLRLQEQGSTRNWRIMIE